MSTTCTETLLALKSQLGMITQANGYRTDVGAVFTGRGALAVGTQQPSPTMTLTIVRDDPVSENGDVDAGQWVQNWRRTIELEVLADGAEDWDVVLDAAIDDVRRALTHVPRPIKIGAIAFMPPASGGATAVAVISISYIYLVDYSEFA